MAEGGLCAAYARLRAVVTDVLAISWIMRVSAMMSILGAVGISVPDQSQECLRILAQDIDTHFALSGLAFLGIALLSIMIWYWARVLVYATLGAGIMTEAGRRPWLARNLPRLYAIIPPLGAAMGLVSAGDLPYKATGLAPLPYMAAACVALAGLLYGFFIARRRFIRPPVTVVEGRVWRRLGPVTSAIAVLSAIAALIVFITYVAAPVASSRLIGTIATLMLWAALLVPLASLLAYAGSVVRFPILGGLLVWALVISGFDLNDNHVIRQQPMEPRAKVLAFKAFQDWLDSRADYDPTKPYPVVLVSAEGGGIRAAYFTAQILATLQDRCPAFAQHVFAISGVSGGSIGAAAFAGLAQAHAANRADLPCDLTAGPHALAQTADQLLGEDFLAPVVAGMLYGDMVARFSPVPLDRFDRARPLEDSLRASWRIITGNDVMSQSVYSLGAPPDGAVPKLLLNSTRVETGDPVVFSSLNLAPNPLVGNLRTFEAMVPDQAPSLATAAFVSARFPLVTPAASVVVKEGKFRLVDGGYYENSGTASLDLLMESLVASGRDIRLVLVRIANGGASTGSENVIDPDKVAQNAPDRYVDQGFNELLSPVRALLNTRSARGEAARRQLEDEAMAFIRQGGKAEIIDFALKPGPVPIPLGWSLSRDARQEMIRQLNVPCAKDPEGNGCAQDAIIRLIKQGGASERS